MNKKETQKPKYNMWQNSAYMVKQAWKVRKSVLPMCVACAAVAASKTITELFIAPTILAKIETTAPLTELLAAILFFCAVLFVLSGLHIYLDANSLYGRIAVRSDIVIQIGNKLATTSYPNIFDTKFVNMENKASQATSSNMEATEHLWSTWTVILTNIIGFVVYLTLLSNLSPFLLVVVMLTTAVGFFLNKNITEKNHAMREEEASILEKLNYMRRTTTKRTYAKDIRIFGLSEWINDVWNSAFLLYEAFLAKREKNLLGTHIIDLCLAFLRNGIAYAYLIHLCLNDGMTASEFLLYFSAVSGFTAWITGILDKFSELHKESLDINTVREFLEWPETFHLYDGIPLEKDLTKDYEIRLEHVSFRYPEAEKDTLTDINLTIHPGEKIAIVGLNGAGKTTLVKLICGFLDPTEGRVLLNGEDIRPFNRRDYYALFSAVFQDFSLLETTVAENVSQCIDGYDEARIWQCLAQAGLEEKVKELPNGIHTHFGREVYEDGVEFSGGQTQRLMLARALYKNGAILVLDEPTAALDPIAENDIYLKYNEMTAGRTALFISHRLASTRFCDRILFLANGQIAEEGTHEGLLAAKAGYADLFEVQSKYYKEGGNEDGSF